SAEQEIGKIVPGSVAGDAIQSGGDAGEGVSAARVVLAQGVGLAPAEIPAELELVRAVYPEHRFANRAGLGMVVTGSRVGQSEDAASREVESGRPPIERQLVGAGDSESALHVSKVGEIRRGELMSLAVGVPAGGDHVQAEMVDV